MTRFHYSPEHDSKHNNIKQNINKTKHKTYIIANERARRAPVSPARMTVFSRASCGRALPQQAPGSTILLASAPAPCVSSAPRVAVHSEAASALRAHDIRASVKIYPSAILSTPGTSGYYIPYNRVYVLRAVLHNPLRSGIVWPRP